MSKAKQSNRSLIISIISIVACVVLLIGATMAWFTDTETNTGNRIEAGTLDITAEWYDLAVDGETLSTTYAIYESATAATAAVEGTKLYDFTFEANPEDFATTEDSMIDDENWQSGAVNAKLVQVTNNGSLDANISLAAVTEDLGLEDALWYDFIAVDANGKQTGDFEIRPMSTLSDVVSSVKVMLPASTTETSSTVQFILVYGMLESAGNAYQDDYSYDGTGYTADIIVTATQTNTTAETVVYAYKAADITSLDKDDADKTVILMDDITDANAEVKIQTNVNIDLNGYTLTVKSFSMDTTDICTVDIVDGEIRAESMSVLIPNGTINLDDMIGTIDTAGTVELNGSKSTINMTGTTKFVDTTGAAKAVTILANTRVVVDTEDDVTINIESGVTGIEIETVENATGNVILTGDTDGTTVNGSTAEEYMDELINNVGIEAGFDGGNGTDEYPFQVSTQAQLVLINNYLSSSFIQTDDITLDNTFTPIGYDNGIKYYFKGNYDGGNFKIDNLNLSGYGTYTGLFMAVNSATIENVNVTNATLTVTDVYCGGIVGYLSNSTIYNCTFDGTINITAGNGAIGGIVGRSEGSNSITYCDVTANIIASDNFNASSIGGVIGHSQTATTTISNCTFKGAIKGGVQSGYGGIVGQLVENGSITNCTSDGWISGGRVVGGIVGSGSEITVTSCTSNMDVYSTTTSMTAFMGGIAGSGATATVTSCIVTGTLYTTYNENTAASKKVEKICGGSTIADESNTFNGSFSYS